MALSITHTTVATLPDEAGAEVNKDEWNAAHTLTGEASLAQGGTGNATGTATVNADLTGIVTSVGNATAIANKAISYTKLADGTDGNLITWDAAGVAALVATGTATHVLTSNGVGTAPTFQVLPAASSTWDTIGAAAGDATTANGDWNIVANWRKTTDLETAFTFGETLASTGGTISSDTIFNQVLLRLTTLAGSTMSPLVVFARGTQAFAINSVSGQSHFQDGTALLPAITFTFDADTGIYQPSNGQVAISCDGAQSVFWGTSGHFASLGSANATGYALNFRKARGTVASPTVITTGDDLGTESGFAYVGSTGYVEATRITFDSTGTIANTTSGLGGIIRFGHAIVGTVGVTEVAMFRSQHLIHEGSSPTITAGGGGAGVGIVGKDEAFEVTIGAGGVATSVEVTFANAFTTNPPVCVAASDTDIVPFKCVVTVTKVTISATLAFTAGSILHVICRGWE